jgi:hypothetical protein
MQGRRVMGPRKLAKWEKDVNLFSYSWACYTNSLSADDKVDTNRTFTSGESSAVIDNRQCNRLSVFRETTVDEITKIVGRAPAKRSKVGAGSNEQRLFIGSSSDFASEASDAT